MKTTTRMSLTLLLALALLLVAVLWRRQQEARESLDVPGVGRIQLATDEERDYWRRVYDPDYNTGDGPSW